MSPEYVATSKDPGADRTLEYGAGRFIFREGDLGTEMYIVHEGKVEILQELPTGPEQLTILEKGDFFGEMSILEELPRAAAARALTDVKLIIIDGATFDSMLRGNPEIAVRIMRKLSRRVRETDAKLRRVLEGQKPEPIAAEVPESPPEKHVAVLVDPASGKRFGVAAQGSTTIGRRDPVTRIQPDVDLTSIDPERSSSRRHAKIFCEEQKFFIVEDIGATNGTFLNNARVRTGVPVEVQSGDAVRFGLVELMFEVV